MKTGNGQRESANKKIWKGGMSKENSNMVKPKAPVKFGAKTNALKKPRN